MKREAQLGARLMMLPFICDRQEAAAPVPASPEPHLPLDTLKIVNPVYRAQEMSVKHPIQIPVDSINPILAFTEQAQGPLEEPYFTINVALNFNHYDHG